MVKRSPVGKHIRYEGLTNPVGVPDVQAFHKAYAVKWVNARWIVVALPVIFVLPWSIGLIVTGAIEESGVSVVTGIIMALISMAAAFGIATSFRMSDARSVRLWRFATDNGWSYTPSMGGGSHQGMVFQQGHSRRFGAVIFYKGTDDTVGFELGEYTYSEGSGKNRRTYWWTYCCVDLDRNVPHMVLDSRRNNLRLFGKDISSNLPTTFRKDQVLSLEGDFNEHFTLYAPKEYERDALYVFTPDLMALLIDNSRWYDAEVIDNKVYFYAPGSGAQNQLTAPSAIYRWLQIIHTVGMKVNRQTDYYADETVGNRAMDMVGAKGQRLRHGVSWFAVAFVIIIIAINVIAGFSGKG